MSSVNTINKSMKYGLQFAASWPGTPLLMFHRLFWMIVMGVFQTYQYSYVIVHYKTDALIDVIDNLTICIPFTIVSIRLIVAWINRGVLQDIFSVMEEECKKYAAIDTSNLMSKTASLSYRLTNTVIFACVISTVFYAAGVFAPEGTNVTESRKLLLKMDLPFDTNSSPIYELVVLSQYIYQASTAFTFGLFTALLLIIVLHVGCQVDIMCQTLAEVSSKTKNQLDFFVSRHQDIIIFTERIEKLFTYITLSQLMSNTLITCCLGYLIVIASHVDNGYAILIKSILFYINVCLEAFIYCFVGEYLTSKSKLIGDTAYEFLWYNLHPRESRLLILVILRSQKGFTFTFGKFTSVSLESFSGFMKASASYVSVLLAMS